MQIVNGLLVLLISASILAMVLLIRQRIFCFESFIYSVFFVDLVPGAIQLVVEMDSLVAGGLASDLHVQDLLLRFMLVCLADAEAGFGVVFAVLVAAIVLCSADLAYLSLSAILKPDI